MRQGCPPSPLSFSIVLVVLSEAIRQRKEIEALQIWKEKNQTFLMCRWHNIIYQIPQKCYQKTCRNEKFSNVKRHRITFYKSVVFQYMNNEHTKEIIDTILFTILLKKLKYLRINQTKIAQNIHKETSEERDKERHQKME